MFERRVDLGIDLAEENTWILPEEIGYDLSKRALQIMHRTLSVDYFWQRITGS